MKRPVTAMFWSVLAGCAVMVAAQSPSDSVLEEMKKCAVCKAIAENPKLMSQMTWETHKIDNGMLCVSTVPKEMTKEFTALHEKMMKNIDRVKADSKSGKTVELCSFCAGMGSLEGAGAKHQTIHTLTGAVSLLTSTNPEIVKKIHTHADQAIAMQKKLQPPK